MRWCSFVGVCCSQPKYVSIIVNCNEEVMRKVEVVVQDIVQEIVQGKNNEGLHERKIAT